MGRNRTSTEGARRRKESEYTKFAVSIKRKRSGVTTRIERRSNRENSENDEKIYDFCSHSGDEKNDGAGTFENTYGERPGELPRNCEKQSAHFKVERVDYFLIKVMPKGPRIKTVQPLECGEKLQSIFDLPQSTISNRSTRKVTCQ